MISIGVIAIVFSVLCSELKHMDHSTELFQFADLG